MSRELDYEIAEKIYGWTWVVHGPGLEALSMHPGERFLLPPNHYWWTIPDAVLPATPDLPIVQEAAMGSNVPRYSEDANLAIALMDRLFEVYLGCRISPNQYRGVIQEGMSKIPGPIAPTFAEALCRLALERHEMARIH